MFLTPDELHELTGRRHAKKQIACLEANGIPYEFSPGGRLLVRVSSLTGEADTSPQVVRRCLRGDDWKSYIVPVIELRQKRTSWKPGCGPNGSGIYFLFIRWALIYVGKSVSVANRLRSHRMAWMDGRPYGKRFTGWAAIEAPEECLHELELYYIQKHKPPFNVKDVPQC